MRSATVYGGSGRQGGFTLLEVMISLFILAIGILGAGALQTVGLQTTNGAYNRTQAMYLASDIVDRMRANRTVLANYNSVDSSTTTAGSTACLKATAGCSPANLATADIAEWIGHFTGTNPVLPDGRGRIINTATNQYQILITWNENEWQSGTYVRTSTQKSYDLRVSFDDH